MTAPSPSNRARAWSEVLEGRISERLAREIDIYETQMELRRQGKLDEKIFAATRPRRGVYGQRYDNGQRHDGFTPRELAYPSADLEKGPSTVWDAPGMMRIKIPYGGLDAEQLEVLADLADEYSDGIAHVTTRQDFQLHFVHIDDTPDLMRRLAAVGITTQEACGNSVRNVTGCPISGVCADEAFDVSPYAHALTHFLLGHKDAQDFGRKFKISFSGCADKACALAHMHDLGLVAKVRGGDDGGHPERGFALYVGGGLGAVDVKEEVVGAADGRVKGHGHMGPGVGGDGRGQVVAAAGDVTVYLVADVVGDAEGAHALAEDRFAVEGATAVAADPGGHRHSHRCCPLPSTE